MIMASSYRKIADLTPPRAPSMTPAVRTKLVVYSEVGVDLRALKGQLDLWVGDYCPSDGHNNRLWPYITVFRTSLGQKVTEHINIERKGRTSAETAIVEN